MPTLEALADRHAAQRRSILEQLLRALLGLWGSFNRPDDAVVASGYAARSAMLVDAAIASTRRIERAYVTATMQEMGVAADPFPADIDYYPRANTTPSEVYARPVEQWIWNRRNGGTAADARAALERRLTDIAEVDISTASRDEASTLYGSQRAFVGYRRIIHPELSTSGTCGLCIAASARVYATDDLLPLHGGTCNCTTLGITRDDDPGLRITDEDLKSIYAAAGSTAAADLQNTRIKVTEHGELGPVLVKQGDHFRTPDEAGRPNYVKRSPEQIAEQRRREVDLLTDQIAAARSAFDAYVGDHPRDSWTSADQQRGYELQRAELDLAARLRQLKSRS